MVRDLNMDVEIVPCPIVREQDGLALSSRNVYLKPEEREQALVLSKSLKTALEQLENGTVETAGEVRELLSRIISESPIAVIDYAEVLAFPALTPVENETKLTDTGSATIMALAVRFGKTRLIDNALFQAKEGISHV